MTHMNAATVVPAPHILECVARASSDWLWKYLSPQGKAKLVMLEVRAHESQEKTAPKPFNFGAAKEPRQGILQLH